MTRHSTSDSVQQGTSLISYWVCTAPVRITSPCICLRNTNTLGLYRTLVLEKTRGREQDTWVQTHQPPRKPLLHLTDGEVTSQAEEGSQGFAPMPRGCAQLSPTHLRSGYPSRTHPQPQQHDANEHTASTFHSGGKIPCREPADKRPGPSTLDNSQKRSARVSYSIHGVNS